MAADRTTFHVHVDPKPGGYSVSVIEVDASGRPQDFAKIDSHLLDVALRMAVPYMAAVAVPDTLAEVIGAFREKDGQ